VPFAGSGFAVEPQIIYPNPDDPFSNYEINPDLRTETVNITFNDIPVNGVRPITTLFQTHKSGVLVEIMLWYPNQQLLVSMWHGQLQAPNIYGHRQIQTVATNGFRSREQLLPKRNRPKECTFTFGGLLSTADAVQSNGCPYDRHLGGTVGNFKTGSTPYSDCPKLTVADCNARLGSPFAPSDGRYFGGFITEAAPFVSDPRNNVVARSTGNDAGLSIPIRVIAGTKHVRGLPVLMSRREPNPNNPEQGWFAAVVEIGEGNLRGASNLKVNGKVIEAIHQAIHGGQRGQHRTPYATNVSQFSSTAIAFIRYGWVDPLTITPANFQAELDISGMGEVAVYNNTQAGSGLVGEYHNNTTWTSPVAERIDFNLNFPSTSIRPMPIVPAIGFSVEWMGFITAEFSETYTFTCIHDNSIFVEIGGITVINEAASGTHTGTKALTADTPTAITVRLSQTSAPPPNPWSCILKWESSSQAQEVVPNSALTHNGSSGFVRQWTSNRVWWLLECYTNQKWGMCYPNTTSRFEIDDWITAAAWTDETVQFQHTFPDGEIKTYTRRRTQFDAIMEGRPASEQITDICRSGAISVPFQHEGKFTVREFRAATSGELSAARVFTDRGEGRNIIWDERQPTTSLSQVPDDKVINEIELSFEEAANSDLERPITVNDPDQQLLAGRSLGGDNLKVVPKKFAAFGVRYLEEAIRLAYRLLWFGEFDEGGIENNLRAKFITPLEQVLNIRRYELIQIVSTRLDDFTFPDTSAIEYFRVLSMRKLSNGQVAVEAQAYNHTAYTAFETVVAPPPDDPGPEIPPGPGPAPEPFPCILSFGSVTYDSGNGQLNVPIPPCA
jgi:hypothetical protein